MTAYRFSVVPMMDRTKNIYKQCVMVIRVRCVCSAKTSVNVLNADIFSRGEVGRKVKKTSSQINRNYLYRP